MAARSTLGMLPSFEDADADLGGEGLAMVSERPSCLCVVPESMLSDAARAMLEAASRLTVWEGPAPIPRARLLDLVTDVDAVLVTPLERIDADVLDRGQRPRVIATLSAGYDHIDVAAASARGILVCNAPGFNAESVADHTFGLLLAVARRFAEQSAYLRAGRFVDVHVEGVFGQPISGATLGLVGLGTIGTAVARRAVGFGMRVLYFGRTRKPDLETEFGLEWTTLDGLLARSDVVSLHAALTAETRGLIGGRELGLMKPTAILLNTARGGLVDTAALCDVLSAGGIFGAGLDVTDPEPLPMGHALFDYPNVVISPHTGYASKPVLAQMVAAAAEGIADALGGRRPRFLVNAAAWGDFTTARAM